MARKIELTKAEADAVSKVTTLLDQHGRIECAFNDPMVADVVEQLTKSKVKSYLVHEHSTVIAVDALTQTIRICFVNGSGSAKAQPAQSQAAQGAAPKATAPAPSTGWRPHRYVPPPFHQRVKDLLKAEHGVNLWFVGPTGSGKTHYVHYLGEELGRKIYQVNCRRDMDSASFLGDRTLVPDQETGQSVVRFQPGPVVEAMLEGVDDKGNEVGPPAILFVDEAAACPPHVAIALNRLLENRGNHRVVALDADGGREVKSHSGFRVICAANVLGRGLTSLSDAEYSAQSDALDISTIDRFAAVFRFGYDRRAERMILMDKVGDDALSAKILKFRDAIRDHCKNGRVRTPFSTRLLVDFADLYAAWQDLPAALYHGVICKVLPEEMSAYAEQAMAIFAVDVRQQCEDPKNYDYMA